MGGGEPLGQYLRCRKKAGVTEEGKSVKKIMLRQRAEGDHTKQVLSFQ